MWRAQAPYRDIRPSVFKKRPTENRAQEHMEERQQVSDFVRSQIPKEGEGAWGVGVCARRMNDTKRNRMRRCETRRNRNAKAMGEDRGSLG